MKFDEFKKKWNQIQILRHRYTPEAIQNRNVHSLGGKMNFILIFKKRQLTSAYVLVLVLYWYWYWYWSCTGTKLVLVIIFQINSYYIIWELRIFYSMTEWFGKCCKATLKKCNILFHILNDRDQSEQWHVAVPFANWNNINKWILTHCNLNICAYIFMLIRNRKRYFYSL